MTRPAGISVVLPTHNRLIIVQRVIEALLPDPAMRELIVVDDGSTDGSGERLKVIAEQQPRVRIISLDGRGAATARQAGLEVAQHEMVLFLDDDVVPRPGLAGGHAKRLVDDDRLVVVGYTPSVLTPRRQPGDAAERAYGRDYEAHTQHWDAGEPVLHALWGGNFSMSTDACIRVGMTSANYHEQHAVHEDRDFGLRCAAEGLHGVFDRSLVGDHHYRRSIRRAAIDSTRRSAGTVRLHDAHHELGPFDEQQYNKGLPPRVAAAFRTIRRTPLREPILWLLTRLTIALGALRLHRASDLMFKITRRFAEHVGIERQRRSAH